MALDWAPAAPGRGVVAVWASAMVQVLTRNAPASFRNTVFIDILEILVLVQATRNGLR
jgi:hypothetical protein